eukprot:5418576-Pyramimonas_sp.AAC.1
MAECSEEIAQFLLTPYPGAGLSGRLDSAVTQGRQEINQIPLDLQRVQTFLDEIDDDVELAKTGQVKDASESWTEWCRIAASGGARPLH